MVPTSSTTLSLEPAGLFAQSSLTLRSFVLLAISDFFKNLLYHWDVSYHFLSFLSQVLNSTLEGRSWGDFTLVSYTFILFLTFHNKHKYLT